MFRVFLRKKILAVNKKKKTLAKDSKAIREKLHGRNRRIFSRYSINHKHLTLMNEQDILLIKEISAKGFSTEVSSRGYERLIIGDVYDARIRYLGEIYDLQARVAWKHDSFVGFEITKSERETLLFIKRLLKPIAIAFSLQPVDATFMKTKNNGKTWYHGDEDSDLYTWHNKETKRLRAWQLSIGENYVQWTDSDGFTSGCLVGVEGRETLMGANLKGHTLDKDHEVDATKKQFAVDVIMALPFSVREEILASITR